MPKRIPLAAINKVRKHRYILKKIAQAKPAERKRMMISAPNQLFNVFKLLCNLVTGGQLNLGKAKRHAKLAKRIGSSTVSTIKGISQQHGGAIGAILAGILPFLTPLLAKLFK